MKKIYILYAIEYKEDDQTNQHKRAIFCFNNKDDAEAELKNELQEYARLWCYVHGCTVKQKKSWETILFYITDCILK